MPDVTLVRQSVGPEGAAPVYTDLNDTDDYEAPNSDGMILVFANAGGNDATVTVETTMRIDGLDLENPTWTVPAGGAYAAAGFPRTWETTRGAIRFAQDQASDVSVACLRA